MRRGILYALLAYGSWGFMPMYWKQLKAIDPLEVLAHRVVWSFAFVMLALTVSKGWREFVALFQSRKTLGLLVLGTSLVAINWYLFIWAVAHGRVIEASFGYFLTPLCNTVLAIVVLRERMQPTQLVALALATVGVTWIGFTQTNIPWIAFALAVSFSLYGLVRKRVKAEPLVGLGVETALMTLPAIAALALVPSHFSGDPVLLVMAGPVTALPLLWFAVSVRALPLSIVGFFQYLAPTIQFLLATVLYGEHFDRHMLIGFTCIWIALFLVAYSIAAKRA